MSHFSEDISASKVRAALANIEDGTGYSYEELDAMDRWLYHEIRHLKKLRAELAEAMPEALGRDFGNQALDELKAEIGEVVASLKEKGL